MSYLKEIWYNSDSVTMTVVLKFQTNIGIMTRDRLHFNCHNTYMSSADIFITPTHNACCFPSAIIAYKLPLRKMEVQKSISNNKKKKNHFPKSNKFSSWIVAPLVVVEH